MLRGQDAAEAVTEHVVLRFGELWPGQRAARGSSRPAPGAGRTGPGQRESGAKKHSAATRKGSKWLRGTPTAFAPKPSCAPKATYLSARYRRIKSAADTGCRSRKCVLRADCQRLWFSDTKSFGPTAPGRRLMPNPDAQSPLT